MAATNVLETENTNPDSINFLKLGIALYQLQKGLSPFVTREIQAIHWDFFINRCDLVQPPCFDGIYLDIFKLHRQPKPSRRNVDFYAMPRDPWEIAKFFLSPSRNTTVASTHECNGTGLCSIIINCKHFDKILDIPYSRTEGHHQDVFSQVKDFSDDIMRSAVLEVTEQDMNTKFDTIVQALQYGPLIHDEDAKRAASEIMKMKNSAFKVSKQMEKYVIEEKLKAIQEYKDEKRKEMTHTIDGNDNAMQAMLVTELVLTKRKMMLEYQKEKDATVDTKVKQQVGGIINEAEDKRYFLGNQEFKAFLDNKNSKDRRRRPETRR